MSMIMQRLIIFFGLFLISLVLSSANAETIVDSAGNGDYTDIEEALQFAVAGDKIIVWDGNYSGHFNINISDIELVGNGSSKTFIQGNNSVANNIVIDADNVTISDFTITGGDWAVYMTDSVKSHVLRNNITGNARGICLYGSASYNLIEENLILDNINNGVFLKSPDPSNYTSHSNTIKNNLISETEYGVYLEGTTNTDVSDNVIREFGMYGIRAISAVNDILDNNTITNGSYGVFATNSYNLTMSKNTIFSNNYGIWAIGGQLMVTDYNESIYLGKHLIDDNAIHGCNVGVRLSGSMNNRIINNRIYNNDYYGLEIDGSSDNITVMNNNLSSNSEGGLYIFSSSSIEIKSNDFIDNKYGIFIRSSSGNYIYENLLSKNNIAIYLNNFSYSNLITMNNISSNVDYGIFSDIYVNATSNYWGDPTGPYNEGKNPYGLGDNASDNVDFMDIDDEEPYKTIESSDPSFIEGKTALFLGTFAVTNYVVSKWITKGISKASKPEIDKIAKWVKQKRDEEKRDEKKRDKEKHDEDES